MYILKPIDHARRAFLRRATALGFTGVALPTALNLAAVGEAAAFNNSDYKALVCIFLYGGNDYANTVVTYDDASYDAYHKIRSSDGSSGPGARTESGIALGQSELAATVLDPTIALANGRRYALHPRMSGLASLFNGGKAAVQLNVGPLVRPLTKAQYLGANRALFPVPPKLFSHNDQQSIWQSSRAEGSTVGWGGNLGDIALSSNANSLFTCISVTGNAVFLSGDTAIQYQVGTAGAVRVQGVTGNVYGSSRVRDALAAVAQQSRGHALENEYNKITKRAVDAESQFNYAISGVALTTSFQQRDQNNNVVPNSLADQLRMVARIIGARATMGNTRQVFLVSLGGFDLHDNLISNQPGLLERVSFAMKALYDATVELGVAEKVTAFTASDFGRTLASNGDGSDHGWGGHQFIVGGAVNGKAFYGYAPPVSVGSTSSPDDQWHVGQGRLLPTTSVDQYAATLGRWFGASPTELSNVLPNLQNFDVSAGGIDYPSNLGFLA